MTDTSLNFDLLARDRASGTFQKFGKNADQASGKVKSLGKSFDVLGKAAKVGLAVAGAAVVAAGVGIVKTGSQYVASLNKIQTLNGASASQMEQVAHQLESNSAAYAKMGMSTGDAAAGVVELTKAGMKLRPAMKSVASTMVLAKAGEIGVADAASLVSNTLNVFKLKARDAAKVANIMANAANVSSADVAGLQQALAMAGNVAAGSGASFKQTAAMLAELSNAGMQGSDAGTSLKTMLLALQAPSSQAAKGLKAIGVSAFDASGKARAIRDVLGDLDEKFKGMTDQARSSKLKQIFGTDAFRSARVIFGNGAAALDKYTRAVGSAGAAQRLANSASRGLAGTFAMAKAEVTSLAQQLYREFSPALDKRLRPAVAWLGEQMPKVVPALRSMGNALSRAGAGAQKMASALGGVDFNNLDGSKIGKALGDAVLSGVKRIGELAGKIGEVLGNMFAKVDWVGLGIKIGQQAPALIIGLVAGIANFDPIALFQQMANHWQAILIAVLTIAFMPAKFAGALEKILIKIPFVGKFLAVALRWINDLGGKLKSFGGDLLKNFWRGFTSSPIPGTAFIGRVLRAIAGLPGALMSFWRSIETRLGVWALDAFEAAGRGARTGIGKMLKFVASIPGKILGALGDVSGLLVHAGESIIEGLLRPLRAGADKVKGVLKGITDKIPDWKGPHDKDKVLLTPAGIAIMEGLLAGLKKRYNPVKDFLQKVTDKVAETGDKLKSLISTRNDFAAGFQSFASSIFGRDTGTDANGNQIPETVAGIKAFQMAQQRQAAQLAANVKRLVGLGLSKSLLTQLQAQGSSGIAQINALASSASRNDIAQLNASDRATSASLNAAGMAAANGVYGSDIAKAKRDADAAVAIAKAVRDVLHNELKGSLHAEIKGSDLLLSWRREVRKQTGKNAPV